LVKIRPENIPQTLALLKKTWQNITSHKPFEYYFLNNEVDRQYMEEARWSKIVSYSSILAILISCLGLLGLTSLRVTQRTKEIGIRKILGASVPGVIKMISQEFITLVTVANLIAWPTAYFVMHRWIQNFAYRISIEVWIFLLAAVLALMIAMSTICLQSIKAAIANPAQSLRYE
jgi:putative ABC transport system permease protein